MDPKLTVVFGGTGGAGHGVVRAFSAAGLPVRAVARSAPKHPIAGVEYVQADALNNAAAARAAQGAEVIVHALNVPYPQWAATMPKFLESMIQAAKGKRLVYVDNLYAFGPPSGPISEALPDAANTPKNRLRAQLAARVLAAHASGELEAVVVRASSFAGVNANGAGFGEEQIREAMEKGAVAWYCRGDQPHSLTAVQDLGSAIVELARADRDAWGRIWLPPTAPAQSATAYTALLSKVAGRPIKLNVLAGWMVRLVSPFNPLAREFLEEAYQFEHPWVVDGSEFAARFPAFRPTPLEEVFAEVVAAVRPAEAVRSAA